LTPRWAGKLFFSRPIPYDCEELAQNLRPADRQEVAAAYGHSGTAEEIAGYVAASADAWVCHTADGLMCLFGVARWRGSSALSPVGIPWMLGTSIVSRNASDLIRSTRAYLAEMRKDYPLLVNFIDARNEPSLRYMRACGATINAPAPYGVEHRAFHRFSLGE